MIATMAPRGGKVARRLFGAGPFGRLVAVHTVTNAADALFTVSLAGSLFFSVSADAARPRILLYLLLTLAPFAVIGPFVAPVVDRARGGYRVVILVTSALRCLTCFAISTTLDSLAFFPLAFVVLVLGRTYSVAKSSLVARLVDDDHRLVASNAQLARLGTVGGVMGGAVGAAVLKATSPVSTAVLAGIAHAVALFIAWRLPRGKGRLRELPSLDDAELHQTRLTFAATAMGVLRASVGFATFLIALVLKRSGEPAWVYGVTLLVGAIGGFVGTLVAGPLRRHLDEQAILVVCLAGTSLVCFVAVATPARVAAGVMASVVALAATVGRQGFDSLTQRLAPDAEKGRAFAGFEIRFELAWVAGGIIPVVLEPSLPAGLTGTAVATLLAGLVYAFGLRELQGEQLVLPMPSRAGSGELAASMVAMARAAAVQGADRLAVILAHGAAEIVAPPVLDPSMVELTALWERSTTGDEVGPADAGRATELAGLIVQRAATPERSG